MFAPARMRGLQDRHGTSRRFVTGIKKDANRDICLTGVEAPLPAISLLPSQPCYEFVLIRNDLGFTLKDRSMPCHCHPFGNFSLQHLQCG